MKRTKQDALKTRNHIINVGLELFLHQGFSVTKLEDIAKKAGVSRGAIYWHFKDKLDIIIELINSEHKRLFQLLDDLFLKDDDPFIKIEKVIDGILDNFFDNQHFSNVIELTWFKIEYTQLTQLIDTKSEATQHFISNFTEIVESAQDKGKIDSKLNPNHIATTIGFMFDGMYRSYFLSGNKNKNNARSLFQTYLKLIKT